MELRVGDATVSNSGREHPFRRLLLIEDRRASREASLADFLTRERGFDCEQMIWESFNPQRVNGSRAELMITVAQTPSGPSLRLIEQLRGITSRVPLLLVLPQQLDAVLLKASQAADDFLLAPVRAEELQCRVERILASHPNSERATSSRLKQDLVMAQMVGNDPGFTAAIAKVAAVAASRAPVLILGETGTGKELCAHAIHSLSARCAGPFVPVDCGTLPEHLIENELFGHTRGAFTDARAEQKGLVTMAEQGTLFLDEIDSLPVTAQSKLLRFIAERTYRPLGSQQSLGADVRVVAATNRDLEAAVRQGQFRQDLYFRLNVLPVRLPPLRERRMDIEILAAHFLASTEGASESHFSPGALRLLEGYEWPGNVRELLNVVQRAVTFSGGRTILPEHLGLNQLTPAADPCPADFREGRRRAIEGFEKRYVEGLLRKHAGNVTRAATEARKDRRVFGRLMNKYQIARDGVRPVGSFCPTGAGDSPERTKTGLGSAVLKGEQKQKSGAGGLA